MIKIEKNEAQENIPGTPLSYGTIMVSALNNQSVSFSGLSSFQGDISVTGKQV